MKKLRCGLLGATGLAGQQFVDALQNHPWFELTQLAASPRSAGKTYQQALIQPNGMSGWFLPTACDERVARIDVVTAEQLRLDSLDVVFSAVESDVAQIFEPKYAQHVPVFSAASAFRYAEDVPLILPPVNPQHAALVKTQQKQRGWKGFIAPIPNCTTTGLAIALKPLEDAFGVDAVLMTSMQAVSGAGRNGGVLMLDVLDNVIPHIPKEEHKVEVETKKILGRPDLKVSCTCTRVPVLEGHTETVSVALRKPASIEAVTATLASFRGEQFESALPSAPLRWIEVLSDPFRPQPRLDRDTHGGMATSVGRIRPDGVLANGVKFVLVSHNTKMGAAKGAVLLGELFHTQNLLAFSGSR
jgi:aspartate-semialdehyde dehydrogenase